MVLFLFFWRVEQKKSTVFMVDLITDQIHCVRSNYTKMRFRLHVLC
jgi:hypothetical protein